ncbi:TetR/AcrR family transcriptional regulator [Patulibacter sp. S7RM1-6]
MSTSRSPSTDPDPAHPPTRLDGEAILRAAEEVLHAEGLGRLTMRRVGAQLGADPTALYRHFRNKDALIVALADRAFGRVSAPDPEATWQEELRRLSREVRRVYETHAEFASALARQAESTPNLERIAERSLAIFARAGLAPADAARAYALLVNLIAGTGLYYATAQLGQVDDELRAAERRAYAALPAERFPHAIAAAPHLFPDPEAVFATSIEMFIDAVTRGFFGTDATPEPEAS